MLSKFRHGRRDKAILGVGLANLIDHLTISLKIWVLNSISFLFFSLLVLVCLSYNPFWTKSCGDASTNVLKRFFEHLCVSRCSRGNLCPAVFFYELKCFGGSLALNNCSRDSQGRRSWKAYLVFFKTAAAAIAILWDGQRLRLELPIAWNRALGVIGNGSRRTTIHQLLGLS